MRSEVVKRDRAKIGEWLKRFRAEYRLTQKQVADSLGIFPEMYRKYELDLTSPSVGIVIDLSRKYGVSADYLLGLSDEPQPRAETVTVPASNNDKITEAAIALVQALREQVRQESQEGTKE